MLCLDMFMGGPARWLIFSGLGLDFWPEDLAWSLKKLYNGSKNNNNKVFLILKRN